MGITPPQSGVSIGDLLHLSQGCRSGITPPQSETPDQWNQISVFVFFFSFFCLFVNNSLMTGVAIVLCVGFG